MFKEEYDIKQKSLLADYESKRKELAKQFARENSIAKIGDTVTDHIGSIKVESIGFYISDTPMCIYRGTELKKDGSPKKIQENRGVYQSNITSVTKS